MEENLFLKIYKKFRIGSKLKKKKKKPYQKFLFLHLK